MRHDPADLLRLLRTPIGRLQLGEALVHAAWPVLFRLARLHRRTLARRTRVVAVIGSFGKTTTARATAAALELEPERLARNYFGFLASAVLGIRPADRHAVLEVGINDVGQMAPYADLVRPDVAVVTAIGSEHNPSLRTLEITRDEKAAMVRALPAEGLAVLNGDDANVRWMGTQTRARVRTFGFAAGNDVRATDVAVDWPHGMRCVLHVDGRARALRVRLLGRPMIDSVLAAVAVALAEGKDLESTIAALEALPPTPGRLQIVPLPSGAFLIRDDFKSPLETVDAALDLLAEIPAERRIVVLGDVEEPPGEAGPLYERLGARVAEVATRAFFLHVYDDGPRYADAAIRRGMPESAITDLRAGIGGAIKRVQAELRPGDVVLVKGGLTQRLARVSLGLRGQAVGCALRTCNAKIVRCDACAMLERGWDGLSTRPFSVADGPLLAPRGARHR